MATFGPTIQTPEPIEEEGFEDVTVFVEDESDEPEMADEEVAIGHGDNIAELLTDDEKNQLVNDVSSGYDNDVQSRSDWASAYVKGLDLMGFKFEDRTQPWQGASGVFHPILSESVIRFQAQAMGELFPASGPARSKVLGKQTAEKMAQAQRIETEMNYQLTEKMEEYRNETEQLLFHLPLAGSSFKKIYYDPIEERPASMFVPAEDLVVNYGATSLEKADRITHVMRKSKEEVQQLIDQGFYADVSLEDSEMVRSDIQEKYDEISGEEPSYTDDQRLCLLEQHAMLTVFEGESPKPYVVTIDKSSHKLLSVRRNWAEDDEKQRKRQHFTHYKYLPGFGFYGFGMINLLGGLTKTATSILRQLIDSGTLANLPAGLKSRGLRIKGDDTPFRPGEFRDVDVPGGAVKDHITFLPYKEPSGVLYQLLGSVVEEARRIGAVAETELSSMKQEMPVGTAFAILERQMKVLTGVQARLHAALKKELKIIARIIHENMDDVYSWDDNEISRFDRTEDFDGRVDVIPVSDPNAATTAQKVVSYQAAMQMAQQAPHLYNMGRLHRQMLELLDIENADEILKLPEDIKAADPVTENMAMLKQEPVKAFQYQDHKAHISVHMAAMQDPKIQQMVGQSPFAQAIQSAMASHVTEHVAMQYRTEIEKRLGVAMPGADEKLPEDVELELSRLTAQAAQQVLGQNQAEQQEAEAEKKRQDPLTQIQMKELELKERKMEYDHESEMLKTEIDAFRAGANIAEMRERLNSEEARAAANLAVKMATEVSAADKVKIDVSKIVLDQIRKLQESGKIDVGD